MGLSDTLVFYGGRAGNSPEMSLGRFASLASEKLGCDVGFVGDDDGVIRRVVVVAGSGFRLALGEARKANVDVILSSELRHDVILGRGNVALVSAPHYFTEAPAMKVLADRLSRLVPAVFIDDPPLIKTVQKDGKRI